MNNYHISLHLLSACSVSNWSEYQSSRWAPVLWPKTSKTLFRSV